MTYNWVGCGTKQLQGFGQKFLALVIVLTMSYTPVLGFEAQTAECTTKIKSVAPLVHAEREWAASDLNAFLYALPDVARLQLMIALDMVKPNAGLDVLKGKDTDVNAIQKQILWLSNNIFVYPFGNQKRIHYHELVLWVAKQIEVDTWVRETQPTMVIERAIIEHIFVKAWDKLTSEQRIALLEKIDTNKILDVVKLTTLSGTAVLAALATTTYFAGFAFYTTMSVTIATVAGFFGITLRFAAYAGVSTTVGILSGPIGWGLIAIGAVVTVGLTGRANVQKTARALLEIHALKVAALEAIGMKCPEVPKKAN